MLFVNENNNIQWIRHYSLLNFNDMEWIEWRIKNHSKRKSEFKFYVSVEGTLKNKTYKNHEKKNSMSPTLQDNICICYSYIW